jgi:protein pelota
MIGSKESKCIGQQDDFFKFINDNAQRTPDCQSLNENRSKIILAHSSSGQKQSLSELLEQPGIQSQLSDTKYAQESAALKRFYRMLSTDACRAFYGYDHVAKAADQDAIETLLLTDSLFRYVQ